MDKKLCQSCGMELIEESLFGKNSDGSRNDDYCCYCYQEGKFSKDETMEEMIESCIPFMIEDGSCKSKEQAREILINIIPKLKRWAK